MKHQKNKEVRRFEMFCMDCLQEAVKENLPYKGLVDYNFKWLDPVRTQLKYKCFTCGNEFMEIVNPVNPKYQEVNSKKELNERLGHKEPNIN